MGGLGALTALERRYTYDGQGALAKPTITDGSWTVYVGGIYEKRSNGTYVKYYSALGRRIAMRDNTGVVHYILADHLGSSWRLGRLLQPLSGSCQAFMQWSLVANGSLWGQDS